MASSGISQPIFWWRNWELWKLKTLNRLHYFKMLILFSPIQNDEKQELVGPVPNQWETDGCCNLLGSDLQCFDRNPAEFHSFFSNFSKVFPHPQTFPGRSSRHVANGQQVSQVHLKPLDLSICSVGITRPIGYSLHGESWYTRLHGNIWKCM